jgi:sugar lactone lactonase YvrE
MPGHPSVFSRLLALGLAAGFGACSGGESREIALPGDRAYPESIAAGSDGTLYVSSLATGGIWRITPQTETVKAWIKPGAFGTRSLLGVAVDTKANMLWVCSNDLSSSGIPGSSEVIGSFVKGFDLTSGEGKVSVQLPGTVALCNDIAVASDGSLFVTNSLAPQILKLRPEREELEVWLETPAFEQPLKNTPGLDGIAFGGDESLYVNNFAQGSVFRIEVKDGAPGRVVKLSLSRKLKGPDGMRSIGGHSFIVTEDTGRVAKVRVEGDGAVIETIAGDLSGPTSVAHADGILWIAEGQLQHLFQPTKRGPPRLPFRIIGVPFEIE